MTDAITCPRSDTVAGYVAEGRGLQDGRFTITTSAGCDIATLGQYLQPHARRLPVEKYYTPAEFDLLRAEGEALGFLRVEAGPLVRSSYHARRALEAATTQAAHA